MQALLCYRTVLPHLLHLWVFLGLKPSLSREVGPNVVPSSVNCNHLLELIPSEKNLLQGKAPSWKCSELRRTPGLAGCNGCIPAVLHLPHPSVSTFPSCTFWMSHGGISLFYLQFPPSATPRANTALKQLQIKGTQMCVRNFCVGKPELPLRTRPAAKPAQQNQPWTSSEERKQHQIQAVLMWITADAYPGRGKVTGF